MKILVISAIRCGGLYFTEQIASNYRLSLFHEPTAEILEETLKDNNCIVKLFVSNPWMNPKELREYAENFDKIFILDRKNKEEQLRATFYMYEYSHDMLVEYYWEDSMFDKENPKNDKQYYIDWLNRMTKRLEFISEVLKEDIIYYEDLYYQTDKVDLKGLKFVPDLKKKLRKKSEKKLV